MAIALRGTAQTGNANNGNDVTLTFDAVTPPLEDDYVIVFGGHGSAVTTLTAPSGYTQIGIHTGSDPIFGAWYKKMGATPDTTVVCSGGGNNADGASYCCWVLSGVDGTTPIDVTTTTAGPTTSTNPDSPSITPTTSGAWVLAMAGSAVFDSSPGTVSGYSNQLTATRNETNDLTTAGATFAWTSGAEDPAAWGTWASGTWYALTVALRPAAGSSDTEIIPPAAQLELSTSAPFFPPGILDELTATPLVALSAARKIRGPYSGPLIRLRKDGGAPGESDFSYDVMGDLDTAAISTWLGADNAFYVTIYDQSGNGYDVTQATAGDQPPYTASDSNLNNRPVADFDGSSDHLEHTALPKADVVGDLSWAGVLRVKAGWVDARCVSAIEGGTGETEAENALFFCAVKGTADNIDLQYIHEYGASGDNEANQFDTNLTDGTGYTAHFVRDNTGNTVDLYINNVAETQFSFTNDPTNTSTNVSHALGARPGGSSVTPVVFAEEIIFDSAISSTDRDTLANDQKIYYGIDVGDVSIEIPAANLELSTTALSLDLGISPDAANLELSTTAPLRSLGIGRIPDAAQVQLSTTAPILSQGLVRQPPAAQLQLSTTAPTVLTPVGIEIPAAQIQLSTTAPTVTFGFEIEIPAAQLQLSTTAPSILTPVGISIPAANLELSSAAPTIEIDRTITIPAAQIQLSTTAPSIGIDKNIEIPAAQLELSTTAPIVLAPLQLSPGAGQLELSTTAPDLLIDYSRIPAAAQLQLSTTAPSVEIDKTLTIPAAQLQLSTTAPSIGIDRERIIPAANLQLSATAPTISIDLVTGDVSIEVPAAQLELSTFAPLLDVPSLAGVAKHNQGTLVGLKHMMGM